MRRVNFSHIQSFVRPGVFHLHPKQMPHPMRKIFLAFSVFLPLSWSVMGQEIKTTVTESNSELKPDIQKEEQFEPANIFVFAGAGIGIRTGDVLTGFLATAGAANPKVHKSYDDANPLRTGICFDLGGRYFLNDNFGIGLRGNYFANMVDFLELDTTGSLFKANNPSSATTRIGSGCVEALYRLYFSSSKKEAFVYGGLGIGLSFINQEQKYRYDRKTLVNESFLMARPFIGINVPVWDVVHFYAESGYQYSQGKISDGTLSLSQLGITAGVHIRLNAF